MKPNLLNILWPSRPDGYLSTWLKNSNRSEFFHSSRFDEAEEYMTRAAQHDDVYFTVGLLGARPHTGRGAAKDIAFLPAVHMDFDMLLDNNVHAKSSLPRDHAELGSFIAEAGIGAPTVMVNSGNGAHAYWRLAEPLAIHDEEGRRSASALLKGFQRMMISLAKLRRGWNFDNTADLARVLRYPGTLNHKTNPPKNVEIFA